VWLTAARIVLVCLVLTGLGWLLMRSAEPSDRDRQALATPNISDEATSVPPALASERASAPEQRIDPSTSPPPPPVAASTMDEATLMRALRATNGGNHERVIELAREGNRRFPKSSEAPERASILIHSLAALGRASEARGEAEDMVNRYPDSPGVREIESFTGAHRHRNIRLTDAGGLEYY